MLLRTLIPMLEHVTILSFQVTHNGNQTGNRLRIPFTLLSMVLPIVLVKTEKHVHQKD